MRFFKPCLFAVWFYPGAVFRIRTKEKILCLTFDDGPDPATTPLLLDTLAKYNIKALFFCNGKSAEKYPGLMARIREEEHLAGNHGYDHLNGWRSSSEKYIADATISSGNNSSKLFRPPYGKIRPGQFRILKLSYKVVFWDLMPYDFDQRFGSNKTLQILKKRIRPGSIIVLHDTIRSTFPEFLDEFILFALDEGYRFVNSVE